MSMFPVGRPRENYEAKLPADGSWPMSMRIGYWLSVVGAILMLVTALIVLGDRSQPGPNVTQEQIDFVTSNTRFYGIGNAVLAVAIGLLAPQLKNGGKFSRRWLAGVIGLACFLNVAGILAQVVGPAAMVIVFVLAFAALHTFKPESNAFVRKHQEF